MALLMSYTETGPGKKVVEAGTGSGALTAMLAYHVKPNGKIYTYEIRQEFLEKAKKNLSRIGLVNNVEFINKDVTNGIDEKNVDTVILDLATPWLVIPHAHDALRGGGIFASFSPTIDQVMKTVEALKSEGFIKIETIECLLRRIMVEPGKTRPETLMIGHTGYMTFARNAEKD
jgi:tRNA (adenine57-N1/adenine58-N1)-methyltransferase